MRDVRNWDIVCVIAQLMLQDKQLHIYFQSALIPLKLVFWRSSELCRTGCVHLPVPMRFSVLCEFYLTHSLAHVKRNQNRPPLVHLRIRRQFNQFYVVRLGLGESLLPRAFGTVLTSKMTTRNAIAPKPVLESRAWGMRVDVSCSTAFTGLSSST
ncbi:hypothetical protein NE237_001940 [Protea cynaroides]|uniref:Uncharacterized protein n=1 Tax=Protea cynaroides TaxID=273540 RepID=A0A9Q0KUH8_9MAGN|nr:hypothetical protein NE237_001940 [Protea cynaroides]